MLWGTISFRLSISFRSFYFLRQDNCLLCNVTTKEFQQRDISSIQTVVLAQTEGEKDLFQLEWGCSGRDSNSTGKGQHFAVCKGKEENNTKKDTKESSGIQYSLLAPLVSAIEEHKHQPLHPKGSLSITDSFQKAFYKPSRLSDILLGFSLALLPSNYQQLSWERRVRCGSVVSVPAGSRGAAEEYVRASTRGCSACSLPPSPTPGNGNHGCCCRLCWPLACSRCREAMQRREPPRRRFVCSCG